MADIAAQIAKLKHERSELYQSLLPDDVQELEPKQQRFAVFQAENDDRMLELDEKIKALRTKQLAGEG